MCPVTSSTFWPMPAHLGFQNLLCLKTAAHFCGKLFMKLKSNIYGIFVRSIHFVVVCGLFVFANIAVYREMCLIVKCLRKNVWDLTIVVVVWLHLQRQQVI